MGTSREESKPATMSTSVGYSRPCCGQSRSWRKTLTRAALSSDTYMMAVDSRSTARLESRPLWTLEHHFNKKKKSSRELLSNFICHFILWLGGRFELFATKSGAVSLQQPFWGVVMEKAQAKLIMFSSNFSRDDWFSWCRDKMEHSPQ